MKIHVNGIDLHYEVNGKGRPIILLHGNGEDMSIFDVLVNDLSKDHTIFSIDTRGHGGSGKVLSFHYADMMNDVAAFIKELDIKKPILYGFSDGGIVGLMLASTYPDMISGLIASGANLRPKDLVFGFRSYVRILNIFKRDPLFKLMLTEPNITDSELEAINIPVLITAGEKDIIPLSHSQYIANTIRNGSLVVASGEDHSSYIIHSEKLHPLIADFLKGLNHNTNEDWGCH